MSNPRSHAIAAGHRVTAEAGAAILDDGGTAMDAALAAALTAMAVEPVLAGLLGGGFAMIRPPEGRAQALDFFVDTPLKRQPGGDLDFRAVYADFGTATQEFHIGAGAIATPGVAPGLAEAHARYGRMPLKALAEPAITAAREGVVITAYQARLAEIVAPILTASPEARALHMADGTLKGAGAMLSNPALADVLEVFGHDGARFIQEGEVAAALLEQTASGGHLRRADLIGYAPRWRTPLGCTRQGARLALNPEPAIGGALIAHALEHLPRRPLPHTIAQALAATDKARRRARLEAPGGVGRLLGAPATRGTTHISVVDATGLGVALTLSNGEGCGLIVPGTGIMANNMLGEPDLMPDGLDSWAEGTRMASMMAPTVVDWPDGRAGVLGSGGSSRIASALTQVLLGLIDGAASPETAITAPRLHAETDALDYEETGLGEGARAALLRAFPEARGWPEPSMYFGGVHAVLREAKGGLAAFADPRRDGWAVVG
ncbi:MAG: gamma-glutamyltransferase [Pseudomonadota bacterium]